MTYVICECIQCKSKRKVGLKESKELSSWGGTPMCEKCGNIMIAKKAVEVKDE